MRSENIAEIFYKNVKKDPDKIALIFEDREFSYLNLARDMALLSLYLTDAGIKRGDKVGILLPNCPEFVVLMLTASNLGITLVPQNMTLPPKSIVEIFDSVGVKHIFGWHSLIYDLKREKNEFLLWVSVGGLCRGVLNYSDMINSKKGVSLAINSISVDEPYIVTMTSGSTSKPKPILLLQSTKIARFKSTKKEYNITKDDTILTATPLYHSLAQRLVLLSLLSGACAVLMAGFTPKEWLENVSKHDVSFTMAVSSQLKQIYRELNNRDYNIDSLRSLVSSSELLDIDLKKELINKLECDFYECYGTSEVACVTNISNKESGKSRSVGKALFGVDIKILKDDNRFATEGEVGEIVCKTPLLFAGYYNRFDLTQESMFNGYFRTGDLGKIDSDGYLYFQGRKKDIIITGGINVYPKDIENVLNRYHKVIESCVISLLDENLGERVVAVVVSRDRSLSIRELQRLCAKELADFQQPREFILVDSLPKNPMGKVLRYKLIDRYRNKDV